MVLMDKGALTHIMTNPNVRRLGKARRFGVCSLFKAMLLLMVYHGLQFRPFLMSLINSIRIIAKFTYSVQ